MPKNEVPQMPQSADQNMEVGPEVIRMEALDLLDKRIRNSFAERSDEYAKDSLECIESSRAKELYATAFVDNSGGVTMKFGVNYKGEKRSMGFHDEKLSVGLFEEISKKNGEGPTEEFRRQLECEGIIEYIELLKKFKGDKSSEQITENKQRALTKALEERRMASAHATGNLKTLDYTV